MAIRILNWSSYQSYKDRRPPWIRFHRSMLDNYEYHGMSANARALLPMLWLLASEDEDPTSGLVGIGIEKISFRLRLNVKEIASGLQECADAGFIDNIQSCNESVTNPLPNRNPRDRGETEERQNGFLDFYSAYPKKKAPADAEKAYNKAVKKIQPDDLLTAAKQYAESVKGADPKYIPHPATWLNGERWRDEPAKKLLAWEKPENKGFML